MIKKLLLVLLLLIVVTAAGIWAANGYLCSKGAPVVVQIEPGQSGGQIAHLLKQKGVIRSEWLFKIILRLTADPRDLKAGTFDLWKNTSDFEVISCLKTTHCLHYEKVTVLEGWRSEEIAEVLAEKGITNAQEFIRLVRQQELEGFLYPSTYLFTLNMAPQKVIDEMVGQYRKTVSPLFKEYPTDLTERQVLTIASIVEREAVWHDERPKIAAVYLNRFRMDKRLEADPTVQYALGFSLAENRYWKKGLTLKDLRMEHPYNTYKNEGLPPGPICNPSYESVKGVLNPQPDFDKIYFVADSGGRHVFSRTFSEHKKNIRRIRSRQN